MKSGVENIEDDRQLRKQLADLQRGFTTVMQILDERLSAGKKAGEQMQTALLTSRKKVTHKQRVNKYL